MGYMRKELERCKCISLIPSDSCIFASNTSGNDIYKTLLFKLQLGLARHNYMWTVAVARSNKCAIGPSDFEKVSHSRTASPSGVASAAYEREGNSTSPEM